MQILYLKLRGAIGIRDGLGLEEIEIDFSKFGPGLIAITGDNGKGKSTILDNMHPFRQLASRDGGLANHFFLKDSLRVLKFQVGIDIYKSEILLDALTGASEAYFYKNNTPLNDGKLTTYDQEIIKILGSTDLFFSSVFSAQKSKGIAELKAGERRELFNEILGLQGYETYCNNAKNELDELRLKLSKAEGEINILKQQLDKYNTVTPQEAVTKTYKALKTKEGIETLKSAILSLQTQIESSHKQISQLEVQQERDSEIRLQINGKEKDLSTQLAERESEKDRIERECRAKSNEFETNNEYRKKIVELEIQKDNLYEKNKKDLGGVDVDIEKVRIEIHEIENEIKTSQGLIARNEQINRNKEVIKNKLAEKKELSELVLKHMGEERRAMDQLNTLQNEEKVDREGLKTLEKDLNTQIRLMDAANTMVDALELKLDTEQKKQKKEIEELGQSIAIIDKVPCEEAIGNQCLFLQRAYHNKTILPDVEKTFNEEINKLKAKLRDSQKEKGQITDKYIIIQKEIDSKTEMINHKYNGNYSKLKEETRIIALDIKEISGKLALLNKDNWEQLSEESKEAEKNIQILSNKVTNLKQLLGEKEKAIVLFESKKINIQNVLKDNLSNLEQQIHSNKDLMLQEKQRIISLYDEKVNQSLSLYASKINEIEKALESLKSSIDLEIELKIIESKSTFSFLKNELKRNEEELETAKIELQNLENEVAEINRQMTEKALTEDEIKMRDAEIQFIQRDIKDYSFLVRAFDKTGIPILKLENSSIAITAIVNDLLDLFDNKFRVIFETVSLTKDKKKLRESFNIIVSSEYGTKEISNMSGGEKTWIETAIQLAIALYRRQQEGREIGTGYLDESDGPLSAKNAFSFFRMIEETHNRSGVYNTFIITHRSELLDMIPQQIVLGEGQIIIKNE